VLAWPDTTTVHRVCEPVPLALLAGVVLFAHHPVVFLGLVLLFLAFTQAYEHTRARSS